MLAIYPASRGFGYAVMESPENLIDWGVKSANGRKNAVCLAQTRELIRFFGPTVLVIEDHRRKGSRRCLRVQSLLESLGRLANHEGVKVRGISPAKVRRTFTPWGAVTKHQRAVVLADRLPELAHHLPPVRKPWMPQDHWTPVFEALALAVAFLEPRDR
ncbi:MAG: hypothetical protein KGS61_18570 [Verrucomicrobia bacterium]|nr:hypothetical protein [Verrucomicrobiota bacterium]